MKKPPQVPGGPKPHHQKIKHRKGDGTFKPAPCGGDGLYNANDPTPAGNPAGTGFDSGMGGIEDDGFVPGADC